LKKAFEEKKMLQAKYQNSKNKENDLIGEKPSDENNLTKDDFDLILDDYKRFLF
jgi:hypothetical protein